MHDPEPTEGEGPGIRLLADNESIRFLVAALVITGISLALFACNDSDDGEESEEVRQLLQSSLQSGADEEEMRAFLRETGYGEGSEVHAAGINTFLAAEGVDSSAKVIAALGPDRGGGVVSCRTQIYFVLAPDGTLDHWLVRDVCTGP